jgi:hypothetical protein
MNVNDLMNMNDMYYVGNIIDVDGDGWVTKSEAQAILDELMGDDDHKATLQQDEQRYDDKKYGDESPDEYKRMMGEVGLLGLS